MPYLKARFDSGVGYLTIQDLKVRISHTCQHLAYGNLRNETERNISFSEMFR